MSAGEPAQRWLKYDYHKNNYVVIKYVDQMQ